MEEEEEDEMKEFCRKEDRNPCVCQKEQRRQFSITTDIVKQRLERRTD